MFRLVQLGPNCTGTPALEMVPIQGLPPVQGPLSLGPVPAPIRLASGRFASYFKALLFHGVCSRPSLECAHYTVKINLEIINVYSFRKNRQSKKTYKSSPENPHVEFRCVEHFK